MATTLEEAALHQLEVHRLLDEGTQWEGELWRFASIAPGYEPRVVPWYGTGIYSVDVVTGEVCDFDGVWVAEGKVLLCKKCFQDGT